MVQDLSRIRAFIQVVEAGGFSAAARANGRSKALLSKYVTDLEHHLGVRLLNRTTRKLSLTDAGEIYARDVRDLVAQLEQLDIAVGEQSEVAQGELRVSAPHNLGETSLLPVLLGFMKEHPKVVLDLRFEDRRVDLVAEGVDVAIRISNMPDSSLISRRLASTSMKLCASRKLIAQYGELSQATQLKGRPCIVDNNLQSPSAWRFEENGESSIVHVSGPIRVNSPIAVRQAAVEGLGYALVPSYLCQSEIESGSLVHLLPEVFKDEITMQVVYPNRDHMPAKVRLFIDYLADQMNSVELF